MILVAGATGVLGSAIVNRLLDAGRPVRIITRRRERAGALSARGAQVAIADLRDRTSLAAACYGTTHVITTANAFLGEGANSVAAVDELGNRNLINAARTAGVRQFIYTSALVPDSYRVLDFFAAKVSTEEYLKASGVPWTILRPAAFMETWALIVGDPLVRAGTTNIFGSGRHPINFVAVDDVAAVAVATVDRPDALNAVVNIVGPENLTLDEVADVFERVTGRQGRRRRLPARILRVMSTLIRPFNPVFARQIRAGSLIDTAPQSHEPAPMLARYPIRLTRLEEWVRKRYAPTRSADR